jgi:glutathione S-transferase
MIDINDRPFKYHLDRMKYPNRYHDADPLAHRAEGTALLTQLEARLIEAHYLSGPAPTFVDIAIFPFIRQFARADLTAWQHAPLPHLRRWLDQLTEIDLFAAAMIKYPRWTAGQDASKDGA